MKQIKQHSKCLTFVIVVVLATIAALPGSRAGRRVHKRFIIHVPFKIKTHHHTHTVYSHIQSAAAHGGGTKQTIYKILGYTAQGKGFGYGHGHGHGHGEIAYEDMHSSCEGHNHGDMIFNHYARNDDDYPEDVEEFLDEEQREEWD